MDTPGFYKNFMHDVIDLMYSIRVKSPEIQKYTREITLRDGDRVVLRPITPEDDQKVMQLYLSLSPETIYFRFFAGRKNVPMKRVRQFTRINYDKNFALVVQYKGKNEEFVGKLIGIGRFIVLPEDSEKAEMSLVMLDGFQRKAIRGGAWGTNRDTGGQMAGSTVCYHGSTGRYYLIIMGFFKRCIRKSRSTPPGW